MRRYLKLIFVIFISLYSITLFSQVTISEGSNITESFTIRTSATAGLPAAWKADKQAIVRTAGGVF
ncbi:MAG: hypothetical protein HY738_24035 [Bacteroidia bacterium]|nr:hypothetical protein [Bacteroidia bacterium]